jgi:hypothetical protein
MLVELQGKREERDSAWQLRNGACAGRFRKLVTLPDNTLFATSVQVGIVDAKVLCSFADIKAGRDFSVQRNPERRL